MPDYSKYLVPLASMMQQEDADVRAILAAQDARMGDIETALAALTADPDPAPNPEPTPDPEPIPDPDLTPDPTEVAANAATLRAKLDAAQGGEIILLDDGDYGPLARSDEFGTHVTLKAKTPLGAKFGPVDLDGCANIRLQGLRIEAPNAIAISGDGSEGLEVIGCRFGGRDGAYASFGARLRGGKNSKFIGNITRYTDKAAIAHFDGFVGMEIVGNDFDHVKADDLKFSAARTGLVEDNLLSRNRPFEVAHQDLMQFQGDPSSNFVIRGNVFLPAEGTDATTQGIFGNLHDSLIEHNLFLSALVRGISVKGGCIVRYNTLIDVEGAVDATRIYSDGGQVEHNIWTEDAGGWKGSNLTVAHGGGEFGIGTLFPGYHGTGTTFQQMAPQGIAIGKGAYAYLAAR